MPTVPLQPSDLFESLADAQIAPRHYAVVPSAAKRLHLPGNPVAASVTAHLVQALSGPSATALVAPIGARLGEAFPHRPGRTVFALARLATGATSESSTFRCDKSGSAALHQLPTAARLVETPAESGDLSLGAVVKYHPMPDVLG